ncbi:MAG: hypothetical protein Q9222_006796 [Ikaeria aurantiellina]
MSRYPSLPIHPGRGLGFLILGASLHDVLTRLKAQPHLYPIIDVSYSPTQPLVAPVILNLPANGFRLRFDGPDQRLRLIEILDFSKTQLSYKNIDLIKVPEERTPNAESQEPPNQHGPAFRHIYNRLMGPTFPGEYLAPNDDTGSHTGLYVLSYPGIAFTFPLQHSAWSPSVDFVSLLSSTAANPAKSLAVFSGASWHEARHDLFTRPCPNPRSLALSAKGKEHQPDEIDLVSVCGGGVVDLIRRSSNPFRIVLGETTPQDLVAELGPPDAIYRKSDHRLSIHKPRRREQRTSHGSYGASPVKSEDLFDTDHSSAHTTTDDSDAEEDNVPGDDNRTQPTAKCFYNYFRHGFDVFISYPPNPSPCFPHAQTPHDPPATVKVTDHLVATKVLLHGNVPGSYPFNRYRRTRWVIDADASGSVHHLDSETSFTRLSDELRNVWKGNYASEQAEKATHNAIVLDRDWGDSPGSSYEVLEGWEDNDQMQKRGASAQEGSGSGTTQIFGFPDARCVVDAGKPGAVLGKNRPKYIKQCADDLYRWQQSRIGAARTGNFILHDGPPYANGPLHIGHALNKILKDITCRFQLSLGKKVDYVPGWDCHGLPIEIKALEKEKNRHVISHGGTINPLQIRQAAKVLADTAFSSQKQSFREWGIMADWNKAWKTMDSDYVLRQLRVFGSMVRGGLIKRRFKPVYWSPSSRTALAEAELEYREDHQSTAAYIKYPMCLDVQGQTMSVNLLIWTTTPWTLPANRAIAIRSDIEYCIVDTSKHGLIIIARPALSHLDSQLDLGSTMVHSFPGSHLVGRAYTDPLTCDAASRPILDASFVSSTTGTGLVHVAPGHGMDDYDLCLKHGITAFAPVDDLGRYTTLALPDRPHILEGKDVLDEASTVVLELYREKGCYVTHLPYIHKYPYDWRTKKPVIIRATEQWFTDLSHIQSAALEALDKVRFAPETGRARLKSFVQNRQEWCISRQRAWGVPIPALYNEATGGAILTNESVDHIISEMSHRGVDAWWSDPQDDTRWITPALIAQHGSTKLRRGRDTMDVWFDSGTSWTEMVSTEHQQADLYLEGTDQHRGWFQSSLLTHVAWQTVSGLPAEDVKAPFKTLITHGFVLDSEGRKMSKSIGNVISPQEIMTGTMLPAIKGRGHDAMGPDALRLWVASSDYKSDVRISVEGLKEVHTYLAKYRTTFRFLLGVVEDFRGPFQEGAEPFRTPHRIVLMRLRQVFRAVQAYYGNAEYNRAVSEINKFILVDLSSSFFESVKDVLYADQGEPRRQTQYALLIIMRSLQTMLAPVTPLLIEEVYDYSPAWIKEHFPHPLQLHWAEQLTLLDRFHDDRLDVDVSNLDKTRAAINTAQERARSRKLLGSGLESCITIQIEETSHSAMAFFRRYLSDLDMLFVVSGVDLVAGDWQKEQTVPWMESEKFVIEGSKAIIHVYKSPLAKCVRCWRYIAAPDAAAQDVLCDRCSSIIESIVR